LVPVSDAADNVRVDAMEVPLIQLVEARGILLGGLNPELIIVVLAHSLVRVIQRKGKKSRVICRLAKFSMTDWESDAGAKRSIVE